MSCIHYKFKSSLDYNSVTFDGLHLSLGDLKKAISAQKRLKQGEFELEITNAQTGDVYKKADELIAKNTSVIVSRVPITKSTANSTQRSWEAFKQECAKVKEKERQMVLEKQKQALEPVAVPASEIDKIKAVIDQSIKGFELSSFAGRHHPLSVPSDSYTCKRCGKKGHFLTNCPNFKQEDRVIEQRVKRTTGIPSTMLTLVDDPLHPGALLTSHGQFAVPTVDVAGYKESKKDRPPFLPGENQAPVPEEKKIPKELLCHICEDLCVDAAIAPCCGTSFCDECLREELLESEDHQCPSCHESNVSPDRIVANRSMRIAVTNFLNDTGYSKVKRRRSNSASGDTGSKLPISAEPPSLLPANPLLGTISNDVVSTSAPVSSMTVAPSSISTTQVTNTSYSRPKEGEDNISSYYRPREGEDNINSYYRPKGGEDNTNTYYRPKGREDNISNFSTSQIHSINNVPYAHKPWNRFNYRPRYDRPPAPRGMPRWNAPLNIPPAFTTTASMAAAAPAVAAAMATLVRHRFGHPLLNLPPFPAGMGNYAERYMGPRPQMPPIASMPDLAAMRPLSPPKKKPVDVFDSFADFTKKKSKTPEFHKSRSRSRSGSQPRRNSRSYSPVKKDSLCRSPRRSRSRSRTPSFGHSRSGARTPILSPAGSRRSQKRSRSNSVTKRRSGSRGLSELRSISPESTGKRSPKLRSVSPFAIKKKSRSPLPLRSRSRTRSRSFKRSYRSRSWSRSKKGRSKSYTPLSPRRSPPRRSLDRSPRRSPIRSPRRSPRRSPLRSPRNSPKRSPLYSPLRSKRSFSPRRRSQSFSPRRRSPLRSKSRSPFGKRRPIYSRSRSPPRKRSLSPFKSRRSPSPYKGYKHRSPSPFQHRDSGGFRERGRDRYPRDNDKGTGRPYHSPQRRPGPGSQPPPLPPSQPGMPANLPPPAPYLPNMPLPAPEEFFKHDPAGYEKFLHNLYAQFGSQVPWVPPGPPTGPPVNPYPPAHPHPPPVYPQDKRSWEPAAISPSRRPRSPSPLARTTSHSPKFSDRHRRDGGRSSFDKVRDRDRKPDDQRFEDRNRRGDYRDKRPDDRDKRVEPRDRKFVSSEIRDKRGGKESEKRRDWEKVKSSDRPRDSGKSKDRVSLEKKKSPDRKRSPQHGSKQSDKPKKVDEKKKERKREDKETSENKVKPEVEDNQADVKKEETDVKVQTENNVPNTDDTKTTISPPEETTQAKKENIPDNVEGSKSAQEPAVEKEKEKKMPGKKKIGTAGTKKLKAKDGNVADGEKKEKKIKKKKLTFGASEADKGLKKKKLKRVVDYKSENNCTSEDATDPDKNNLLEASPVKKAKIDSNGNEQESTPKLEPMVNGEPFEDNSSLPNASQSLDESVGGEGEKDSSPDKSKTGVMTELPELSKWERDDFDIPEMEKPEEKPKEKIALPRSVVDKAEKFLVEKPMKNSVIAASVTSVENTIDVSDKLREVSDKHKDVQEKVSRNVSEKHSRDVPSRPKDKDLSDRRDDRHRGMSDRQRISNDERSREESERYKEMSDKRKDYNKDYRSKSPTYNKDYRSGHNRDYRARSPTHIKDKRTKSPVPNNRDHRSKSPTHTKDYRSKSPSTNRSRKVFVDSKKDYHDRKGSDIQITFKGEKPKKGLNGGGDSSTYHSNQDRQDIVDEDERSVVRSHSLEREMKTSKRRKSKEDAKEHVSSREKKMDKKEPFSSKSKNKKPKEKSEETAATMTRKDNPPKASEDTVVPQKSPRDLRHNPSKSSEDTVVPHKSPRDLRHKIEEKTKSQSSQRKLSVMDESEFVPDYEDLAPETTAGDKENSSSGQEESSPEHKENKLKRKSSEEGSGEQEEGVKPKKAKKKHKHKEKKEKKEKHKHKKKKHKKNKEQEDE